MESHARNEETKVMELRGKRSGMRFQGYTPHENKINIELGFKNLEKRIHAMLILFLLSSFSSLYYSRIYKLRNLNKQK